MIKFIFKSVTVLILLVLSTVSWFFVTRELKKTKNPLAEIVPAIQVVSKKIKETLSGETSCIAQVKYSIGTIDPRFQISREDFQESIRKASAVWENAVGQDIFIEQDSGGLRINLVYDARQESTNQLTSLGLQIENTKSSFDTLKKKYESIHAQYLDNKKQLDILIIEYTDRNARYEEQVLYWNNRGGAPKAQFETLEKEREALAVLVETLQTKQENLNQLVPTMNALVHALNSIMQDLNMGIGAFNTIGKQTPAFEQGVYIRSGPVERIDIFEFSTRRQLFRVLAHELGHAVGLEHLDNPQAIMYKQNQATNETLTKTDLSAIRKLCGVVE
jgi:hypothetical protein